MTLMLGAGLSVLQGSIFDCLARDAGAFGKHGFVSTKIGVCTDLSLGPSSRPLPFRLPPPSSG